MISVEKDCYICKWECLGGCALKFDDKGNRGAVVEDPSDCELFEFAKNTTTIMKNKERSGSL